MAVENIEKGTVLTAANKDASRSGIIQFVGDWMPSGPVSGGGAQDGTLRVGNLECVFADRAHECRKAWTSVLPTSCMDNLRDCGFAALSLANNHVYDAGDNAFRKMVENLERRCPDIQFFGTRERPFAALSQGGEKTAVIGSLEPCRSRGAGLFREEDVESLIREIRGAHARVFVYPHWGKEGEYTRYPSPRQRELARRWIEAGADGVFGSHSHVFQGRETFQGRPIYYSLGNFAFPHPENRLYAGTDVGLCVGLKPKGPNAVPEESFVKVGEDLAEDSDETATARQVLEACSAPLAAWTAWKWARAIGPLYLRKNTASWKIRLGKSFLMTLPKFVAWQLMPKTLLFRIAGCGRLKNGDVV